MYRTHYGLNSPPFAPRPDIRFLYLDENRYRVLEMIGYVVRERGGFCVVSGKAGIGKTILVQALIKRLGEQVHAGLVTCVPGATPRITELVATAFNIDIENASTREIYRRIKNYVADLSLAGKRALLVIDNAHHLKPATFKLLVHLVSVDEALRVILVGHPELRQQFCRRAFGDTAPDVIIQTSISEFNKRDTDAYIRHRIVAAGGAENLFSQSATETVYRLSRGIPGLINCACNYALEAGYEGNHRIIDKSIITNSLKDRRGVDTAGRADKRQKVAAIPEVAGDSGGKKPRPETGASDEQAMQALVPLSSKPQHRKSRWPVYARVAGILLPATALVWLFFQLRPGEQLDQDAGTQVANNAQPAMEQLDEGDSRHMDSSPAPLASQPAQSEPIETTDKLAKIDALNELKAMQRKLEGHVVDQRAEQARIKEATQQEKAMQRELEGQLAAQRTEQARLDKAAQRERDHVVEAGSFPGEAAKPVTERLQDTPGYAPPTEFASLDQTDRPAMIEALREEQRIMERRIAAQRLEYTRITEEIQIENDRIVKARALIQRAYKAARLIWNHIHTATPEPFPEDADQS